MPDQQRDGRCETTLLSSEGGLPESEEAGGFTRQLFGLPLSNARPTPAPANPQVVQKPVSRVERDNPREFQINQIRRRFDPAERHDACGTHLTFSMKPSDPDFFYDIMGLDFILGVPATYPAYGEPTLEVINGDLDTSRRRLVEQKFKQLSMDFKSGNLLSWMNALDRHLANLLSDTSAPGTSDPPSQKGLKVSSSTCDHSIPSGKSTRKQKAVAIVSTVGDPQRRTKEIGQLKSRLGKHPSFLAHSDGAKFTIGIKPFQQRLLPTALQSLKAITLIVPSNYPGEPCQIAIPEIVDNSARFTEQAFYQHSMDNPGVSLIAHINYLAAMMHKMAYRQSDVPDADLHTDLETISREEVSPVRRASPPPPPEEPRLTAVHTEADDLEDRSHIQVIPRPPEWETPDDGDSAASDEEPITDPPAHDVGGRKVLILCPALELQGIELLELKNLSLTLRCARCKELQDMKNINVGDEGYSIPRNVVKSCQKCSNRLSAGKQKLNKLR
ncbi:CHY zinc finger domain-containing protein [Arthroderma uncinatum]|uniref:CHY zinc finger domain-containing protein n=1 Tax=Arthroderma uncinatum TaxID=74035 RepID=UPI00144AACFA|nr:CHY zinc finger domain-containing protein [Arthroderma uncinatum]KAF3491323.1 CHY zinc finger domain-containing protein [Arthroderma uncinatum]